MPVPFTIDFTAPGVASNVTLATLAQLFDVPGYPSSVRLTWSTIPTAPENIDRIEIWALDDVQVTRIARFTDPAVSQFTYHYPRSGKNTTYQIFQFVKGASGAVTAGLWAQVAAQITLPYISMVNTAAPISRRVVFDAWDSFRERLLQTQEWQIPAGGSNYIELAGSLRGRDLPMSASLYDRADGVTAQQLKSAFTTLFDTRDPICVRHPRGDKWFSRFNGDAEVDYLPGGVRYRLSWTMRRIAYTEGAV
jgi:hypothetical protein